MGEANRDDMTHASTSGISFNQESTCSENSNDNVVNYQEFIDYLQKGLKKKKNDILRIKEDNLQLRAKVTHLDE